MNRISSIRSQLGAILSTKKFAPLAALGVILIISAPMLWAGNVFQSAPLSLLSIVFAWLYIWVLLWLKESNWEEYGFKRPKRWIYTILIAVGSVITLHLIVHFILMPITIKLTGQIPDISRFDVLRGNLSALIFGLVIIWTLAAFAEEMIFRGYIMNTLANLFKNKIIGCIVGVVISSFIFGIGHFYQGISGVIVTGIIGFMYAVVYLVFGCNLWIPILIHGLYDTSAFLIIYFSLDKAPM